MADYWVLVGSAPAGGIENVVTEHSHIDQQLDQRHLLLRGETVMSSTITQTCVPVLSFCFLLLLLRRIITFPLFVVVGEK